MASSEEDQLGAGAFYDIMDKIDADILQIPKKWNWNWVFTHQGLFSKKISSIRASAVSNVHLNIKMFQQKYWNVMQEEIQVNKT